MAMHTPVGVQIVEETFRRFRPELLGKLAQVDGFVAKSIREDMPGKEAPLQEVNDSLKRLQLATQPQLQLLHGRTERKGMEAMDAAVHGIDEAVRQEDGTSGGCSDKDREILSTLIGNKKAICRKDIEAAELKFETDYAEVRKGRDC